MDAGGVFMRLHISREATAQKGLLGGDKGNNYHLFAQLEVDPDELALIERHKLQSVPLTTNAINGTEIPAHTIGKLLEGQSDYLASLSSLRRVEGDLISASQAFAEMLEYAESFDEQRIIDLDLVTAT